MSKLEKVSQKRYKRIKLKRAILATVETAGLVSVALLAPQVIGALRTVGFAPSVRHKDSIRVSRNRLVRTGLLTYEGKFLRLTEKGKKILHTLDLKEYKLSHPKRWDKR